MSIRPIRPSHTLSVMKAETPSQINRIKQVVVEWEAMAREKEFLESDREWKGKFSDCVFLLCHAPIYFSEVGPGSSHFVHVAHDCHGREQGLMFSSLRKASLYVKILITNPKNLGARVNRGEENRVQGVGSRLLREAEFTAEERGKSSVTLTSNWNSQGFYLKLGYRFIPKSDAGMSKQVQILDQAV